MSTYFLLIHMDKNKFWIVILSCIILNSCAGIKESQKAIFLDKSYCNKQIVEKYTEDHLPKSIHNLYLDSSLTNRLSMSSLNIANAIGILDLLTKYYNFMSFYRMHPTTETKINLIEMMQQINFKINVASLEVSAISSELDCEEERASQFANYLKDKESKTENSLIIGSIIIGASGAIAAEFISNNSSNNNLASEFTIGVSLIEATLGVAILLNKKKIEFRHPVNALSDIWTNSAVSRYFPPSIWYYLNYENPKKNEKSLAKLLVDKWLIFGQVSKGNDKSKNKMYDLLFGEGGKYSADQLKNRAEMLDQTESYVSLMKQDLKKLSFEIEKLSFN